MESVTTSFQALEAARAALLTVGGEKSVTSFENDLALACMNKMRAIESRPENVRKRLDDRYLKQRLLKEVKHRSWGCSENAWVASAVERVPREVALKGERVAYLERIASEREWKGSEEQLDWCRIPVPDGVQDLTCAISGETFVKKIIDGDLFYVHVVRLEEQDVALYPGVAGLAAGSLVKYECLAQGSVEGVASRWRLSSAHAAHASPASSPAVALSTPVTLHYTHPVPEPPSQQSGSLWHYHQPSDSHRHHPSGGSSRDDGGSSRDDHRDDHRDDRSRDDRRDYGRDRDHGRDRDYGRDRGRDRDSRRHSRTRGDGHSRRGSMLYHDSTTRSRPNRWARYPGGRPPMSHYTSELILRPYYPNGYDRWANEQTTACDTCWTEEGSLEAFFMGSSRTSGEWFLPVLSLSSLCHHPN